MLETLREMAPNSILDVGCGEGNLLECLARCDDGLPIELLAGIDLSFDTVEQASESILATAELQQLDGRWRPLEVTLLHGTYPGFSFDCEELLPNSNTRRGYLKP